MTLISYMCVVIVFMILAGAGYVNDNEKDSNKGLLAYFRLVAALLLWPLTLIALPFAILAVSYHERSKDKVGELRNIELGSRYEQTIEIVKITPTDTLKSLIKAARKGKIEIKLHHIEIIKRELVDRITENNLLK